MILGRRACLTCLVALTVASSPASEKAGPEPPAAKQAAAPLRTLQDVVFGQNQYLAWVGPPRCDQHGNVYLLPIEGTRDGEIRSRAQAYSRPCAVLGFSADGKKTTRFDPTAIPGLAGAEEVTTTSMALDAGGTLFLLVWVRRGESGRQYIASFDSTGRFRSRIEIDPEEIAVGHFEVFGSGEFLLRGSRPQWDGERVGVISARGGVLRDLIGLPVEERADPMVPPRLSPHMVRGGDGRIYFAGQGDGAIHVIDASAESRHAFVLAQAQRGLRLVDLKASGTRLAATYYDEESGKGRYWIAVYDVVLGEQVALYGPAQGPPVCYEYERGSQDQFTVIGEGSRLVTLAP